MAETDAPETLAKPEQTEPPAQGMDIEAQADDTTAGDGAAVKRAREESDADENVDEEAKKPKVEKSVEEQRLEKEDGEEEEKKSDSVPVPEKAEVTVGPKSFGSSVEMFDYFYQFLHSWSPNVNVNKYEHIMLLDLLKKGHSEPDKKIGTGVRAFQIRFHPQFKSRCYFIIREDESEDDFSFRKCVHQILPLPENMQIKPDVNKTLGRGRGRGRGHGRGRGGRPRN